MRRSRSAQPWLTRDTGAIARQCDQAEALWQLQMGHRPALVADRHGVRRQVAELQHWSSQLQITFGPEEEALATRVQSLRQRCEARLTHLEGLPLDWTQVHAVDRIALAFALAQNVARLMPARLAHAANPPILTRIADLRQQLADAVEVPPWRERLSGSLDHWARALAVEPPPMRATGDDDGAPERPGGVRGHALLLLIAARASLRDRPAVCVDPGALAEWIALSSRVPAGAGADVLARARDAWAVLADQARDARAGASPEQITAAILQDVARLTRRVRATVQRLSRAQLAATAPAPTWRRQRARVRAALFGLALRLQEHLVQSERLARADLSHPGLDEALALAEAALNRAAALWYVGTVDSTAALPSGRRGLA